MAVCEAIRWLMFLKNRLYIGHNFADYFVTSQPIFKKSIYEHEIFGAHVGCTRSDCGEGCE